MRLRILDILREGEACVCHLQAVLGKRQPCIFTSGRPSRSRPG